jgi:hypothetical protein
LEDLGIEGRITLMCISNKLNVDWIWLGKKVMSFRIYKTLWRGVHEQLILAASQEGP